MIQSKLWTGLVFSCSNVYINCLVRKLAICELMEAVNKDGHMLKINGIKFYDLSHYTAVVSYSYE